MNLLDWSIILSESMLGIAVLIGLYRLAVGPTVVDRILAFDLVVLTIVAFSALLSISEGTAHFVELVLVISLLGFFGTVLLVLALENREQNSSS